MKRKNPNRLAYLQGFRQGQAWANDPRCHATGQARVERFRQNARRQIEEILAQRTSGMQPATAQSIDLPDPFPSGMEGPLKRGER